MIQLENIVKNYYLGRLIVKVLKGIDLTIYKGEYVAIMGPSGSGKSTLMNIIGFLDRPTGGTYKFLGHDTTKLNDNDLATIRNQKIGFIFQSYNLLARTTALDNVELPLIYAGIPTKERKERAFEALKKVGLSNRIDHLSNELSGGQQQRVAIARAIVNDPDIIFADEPTGNLDSKTEVEIIDLFEQINNSGNTILLVTHEEDIANCSKRIIRLRDGLIQKDEVVPHVRNDHQSDITKKGLLKDSKN
ncbi:ABC transporter ATP-binding protein [Patescibacteria group bacterium]|nr:ABC transporter ATP-binding protein [Patescibacteria group bacterium]